MTRAALNSLILSWLDDTNAGYFTSAQTNVWLNLAQREVQKLLLQGGDNRYMKPVETTLVVGQADYVLPSDFIIEHRIEIVLSGTGTSENRQALNSITTNQQDNISIALGSPTNYYIKKNRITLSPTPQTALTMRLYYSPRVADMTADTDSPDVPEEYMEYVAILAAFDGFIKDDRAPTNLEMKRQRYEKLLEQMSTDRLQDQSRYVIMVDDDGIY